MSLESIARDLRLKQRAFLLRGAFIVESHNKLTLKCDVLENFQNSTSRVITRHPRAREPLSIEKKRAAALSRTEAGGDA